MDFTHKLYKKYGFAFTSIFLKLGITPNQLTLANFIITLVGGCWFFSRGTHMGYMLGLGVCALNVLLDYADGDLAKSTKQVSRLGLWLDPATDVILQNAIMAAIGIGANIPPLIVIVYLIFNGALNLVSIQYNNRFGFDSYNGSTIFRKYMDMKPTFINYFFKCLLDPTTNFSATWMYTIRYWIVIGAVLNIMQAAFLVITTYTIFRCTIMYIIYALHLAEYKNLWVCQALAIMDRDRQEYYKCRHMT